MSQSLVETLKKGGIGVIPTDTIYGLVGSALNKKTVERIYKLRKRSPKKPMIILISDISELNKFNISLSEKIFDFLKTNWPNSLSVVLDCQNKNYEYLHRGTNTLAFRVPKDEALKNLLSETGPLVAPSANFEGEKPAANVEEAKKYFGDNVDFYQDAGSLSNPPSTVIKFENDQVRLLRQGSYKIND